jgi:hypothetical protein
MSPDSKNTNSPVEESLEYKKILYMLETTERKKSTIKK